jgi:hypothetical protein
MHSCASQTFYDRLGHAVADEMVEWFNHVDAAYRNDLREVNELNFARFDAKLEQRLAESRVELIDRIAGLRVELVDRMGALEAKLERRLGEQSRWLVGVWITVIGAAVALWFRR